jgi:hypothetical protein
MVKKAAARTVLHGKLGVVDVGVNVSVSVVMGGQLTIYFRHVAKGKEGYSQNSVPWKAGFR